jgi:hypothetical protein
MQITRVLQVMAVATVALLGAAGCKGSCRQLAEKLCECEANTVDRERCLQNVSQRSSGAVVTADDEVACEALLDQCDCNNIDTAEGKRACGMAR